MLAAVTRSPGEMVIENVSSPGPARAGNVIVQPEAVGICGSDFHLYSGDVGALSGVRDFYPRVQGHEVSAIVVDPGDAKTVAGTVAGTMAGTVAGTGAGTVAEGERVAIWPLLPCGTCYPCRANSPP